MKYYLGMDIGGTKCAVVLGEKGSSSVKDKIRFDTRSERGWRTCFFCFAFSTEKICNNCKNIQCDTRMIKRKT